MTRDEAKEAIITSYDEYEHNKNMDTIDKIYDDFDKKMKIAKERSLKQLQDIYDLEDKLYPDE